MNTIEWHLDEYLKLEADFAAVFEKCKTETMTSPERMFALWQAVEHVSSGGVEGDIVECGIWRGGSSMLAVGALNHFKDQTRNIWLYDTFDGMPPPDEVDVEAISGDQASDIMERDSDRKNSYVWAMADKALVQANMLSMGYPTDQVHLIEGMVENTIPHQAPDKIAILRLDTDWYSSTMHELIHLWPRVVEGGVIIIDDYGYWKGARLAVDEYFDSRSDKPLLSRIDITGRIGVKTK